MLTACGQQDKQETTMDFVDNVKVALADSGRIEPTITTNCCDSSKPFMASARCTSTTLLPVLQAVSNIIKNAIENS